MNCSNEKKNRRRTLTIMKCGENVPIKYTTILECASKKKRFGSKDLYEVGIFFEDTMVDNLHFEYWYSEKNHKIMIKNKSKFGCFFKHENGEVDIENKQFLISDTLFEIKKDNNGEYVLKYNDIEAEHLLKGHKKLISENLSDQDTSDSEPESQKKKKYHIGRYGKLNQDENKISLDDDLGVSREHCCLNYKDDKWHIEDENSLNGVYIKRGEKKGEKLEWDQRIRIGMDTFIYFSEEEI